MEDLDRFLSKFEDDGYEFQSKAKEWGQLVVGTRARGGGGKSTLTGILGSALGLTHKMIVAFFDSSAPSPDSFEAFLKDSNRFYKDNLASSELEAVIVLTREKFDRRSLSTVMKSASKEVARLLDYRVLPGPKGAGAPSPGKQQAPAPSPSEPSITPNKIDYDAIMRALPAPTSRERVLYGWEVLLDQQPNPGQTYLIVTQERGLLMRKVSSDFIPDTSFRWEQTGEPATEIDAGGPVLRLYDGSREHRLRNRDAQFIQVLIHHLKYAREGWISGHMRELGFDPELLDRCQADFTAERYSLAVRNAFTLLETRVRLESLAPRDKSGVDLATYAFHPQEGRIPVGLTLGEREGVYLLFRGAFIAFRDPAAHNDQLVGVDRGAAFHQLALVDLLLRLTLKGREQFQRGAL
jgi:hypothetical protein